MTRFARNLVVMLSVTFTVVVVVGISMARKRRQAAAVAGEERPVPAAEVARPAAAPAPLPTPPPVSPPRADAVVRGRLVDDETGQAVAGAQVTYRQGARQQGLDAPITSAATTGRDGAFTVPRLPSGAYVRMLVEKPGYLSDIVEARVPVGEKALDVGTVRLIKGDWKKKIDGGPRGLVGLEHELREGKVLVTGVRPETPAQRAGIQRGEGIVSVDGKTMDNLPHAARTYFLQGKAGTKVSLVVQSRDGARRTVVLERQQVPGVADIPHFY